MAGDRARVARDPRRCGRNARRRPAALGAYAFEELAREAETSVDGSMLPGGQVVGYYKLDGPLLFVVFPEAIVAITGGKDATEDLTERFALFEAVAATTSFAGG